MPESIKVIVDVTRGSEFVEINSVMFFKVEKCLLKSPFNSGANRSACRGVTFNESFELWRVIIGVTIVLSSTSKPFIGRKKDWQVNKDRELEY